MPPYFDQPLMAVDSTSNVVDGVRQFGHVIDVFDGATNAYTGSIDVDALDTAAGPQLNWLAVDGSSLCCTCRPGRTRTGGDSYHRHRGRDRYPLASSIALSDLQSTVGALALDTTNQLLFVANSSPSSILHDTPALPLLVDGPPHGTSPGGRREATDLGRTAQRLEAHQSARLVADAPVARRRSGRWLQPGHFSPARECARQWGRPDHHRQPPNPGTASGSTEHETPGADIHLTAANSHRNHGLSPPV